MGGPNTIPFLIGALLLAVGVFGQEQHSHIFHDSPILNDGPNATTIAALQDLKSLNVNVVGFYKALRELYLTNGFDAGLGFNGIILAHKLIPDFQYQELIRFIENTKAEINSGDVSFKGIKAMLWLNDPEVLVREPWQIELAAAILQFSVNSKNVAYSIRDLGQYLIDKKYTRLDYGNGTYLRARIEEWASANLVGENVTSWVEPFVIAHHTLGPENFTGLGEVLEGLPWLTKNGMYARDGDYVKFRQDRINSAISNIDIAGPLLSGILEAFENATQTKGDNTLLVRMAQEEILSSPDSPVFNGASSDFNTNHLNESVKKMQSILADIKLKINNDQVYQKFMNTAKQAISSGIEGFEGVKKAFVAGARLIKNLGGSVQNANAKCQEVANMADKDPQAFNRFNSAIQVVLKMNKTDATGRQGYKILFEQYLEKPNPSNEFLFEPSRFEDLTALQKFLSDVSAPPSNEFLTAINSLIRRNLRLSVFRDWVRANDRDWVLVGNLQQNFGIRLSLEDAKKVQIVMKDIVERAKTQKDLQDYLNAVQQVVKSGSAETITKTITDVEKLSRDGLKLDVYDSLAFMSSLASGSPESLAPFKGLEPMIINNGTYLEVLLTLQSLLEEPRTIRYKCDYIASFFTEPNLSVAESLGVNVEKIRKQNEVIVPVGALVELLKVTGNFATLGRLLLFHKGHTTKPDPMDSAVVIANMLVYLQENGWK